MALNTMNKKKLITNLAILYFLIGFVFAIGFAIYYRWEAFGFLSPGFYAVVFTWPFQIPGFLTDFARYGFSQKPI
jgi:hypothetical protein